MDTDEQNELRAALTKILILAGKTWTEEFGREPNEAERVMIALWVADHYGLPRPAEWTN